MAKMLRIVFKDDCRLKESLDIKAPSLGQIENWFKYGFMNVEGVIIPMSSVSHMYLKEN